MLAAGKLNYKGCDEVGEFFVDPRYKKIEIKTQSNAIEGLTTYYAVQEENQVN